MYFYMSFTTPTIDVYLPGSTLGIGNVNAGKINIGKAGTIINFGGEMNSNNAITVPICTTTTMNASIIDSGGNFSIGTLTANAITIGKLGTTTTVSGPLIAPTVSYPDNTTNVATTQYVTSAISAGGGVSLTSNNRWTGTNTFTNTLGINASAIDSTGNFSIGTLTANAITIGKLGTTTTVSGPLIAPTVSYPDNTTNVATTQYVTSAIAAGGGGGSVSLSSNNTWTGINSFTNNAAVNASCFNASRIDSQSVGGFLIGTTRANAITIGKAGILTTNSGTFTSTQLITGTAGVKTNSLDSIGTTLAVGPSSTTLNIGKLNAAIKMLGNLRSPSLDTDGTERLSMGVARAAEVYIGSNTIHTTIGGKKPVLMGSINGIAAQEERYCIQAGNFLQYPNDVPNSLTYAFNPPYIEEPIIFINGASIQQITNTELMINATVKGSWMTIGPY